MSSSAGISSLVSVDLVEQWAQESGHRRVIASDTPAAGTFRSDNTSTRCNGIPLSRPSNLFGRS
jgi:hypothetical protein